MNTAFWKPDGTSAQENRRTTGSLCLRRLALVLAISLLLSLTAAGVGGDRDPKAVVHQVTMGGWATNGGVDSRRERHLHSWALFDARLRGWCGSSRLAIVPLQVVAMIYVRSATAIPVRVRGPTDPEDIAHPHTTSVAAASDPQSLSPGRQDDRQLRDVARHHLSPPITQPQYSRSRQQSRHDRFGIEWVTGSQVAGDTVIRVPLGLGVGARRMLVDADVSSVEKVTARRISATTARCDRVGRLVASPNGVTATRRVATRRRRDNQEIQTIGG